MTSSATAETAPRTSSPPPIEHGVELGLVEWGNLALRAGRVAPNYPQMAWLQRFAGSVPLADLQAEARRLGTNPYGFGRRLTKSRFPGGRMRWRQCENVAPVEFEPQPVDDWKGWVDDKFGRRLDPETGHGWTMLACETTGGETVVLVLMHHLFGTARGIMDACFNSDRHDPLTGSTGYTFTREHDYSAKAELRSILQRVWFGLAGVSAALRAIPAMIRNYRGDRTASAPGLPVPLKPARGNDPSRKPLSADRVHAHFPISVERLDAVAGEFGGSANTLLTAITANLLRRARIARGGPIERPIQLVLPMDLPDDVKRAKLARVGKDKDAENLLITAAVVLPGGPPVHADLTETRARMKEAYIADSKAGDAVRGANDIARLFPERLTFFFALRAAVAFDGCVSNVGELPEGFRGLGEHEAVESEMIGYPIGNELIGAITQSGGVVALTFVTDPARMGQNQDLRQWLTDELAAWGINEGGQT